MTNTLEKNPAAQTGESGAAQSREASSFVSALRERSNSRNIAVRDAALSDRQSSDRKLGRHLSYRLTSEIGPDFLGKAFVLFVETNRIELSAWKEQAALGDGLLCCRETSPDEPAPILLGSLDAQAIRNLTTVVMGGQPDPAAEDKTGPLSRIERSIGEMFYQDVTTIVARETGLSIPAPAIVEADTLAGDELGTRTYLALTFKLRVGSAEKLLRVAVDEALYDEQRAAKAKAEAAAGPSDWLASVAPDAADAGKDKAGSGEAAAAPKGPLDQLSRFGNLPIPVTFRFDSGKRTLGDIAELQVGQVIPLDSKSMRNCQMQIGDRTVMAGELGRRGQSLCLRVKDVKNI